MVKKPSGWQIEIEDRKSSESTRTRVVFGEKTAAESRKEEIQGALEKTHSGRFRVALAMPVTIESLQALKFKLREGVEKTTALSKLEKSAVYWKEISVEPTTLVTVEAYPEMVEEVKTEIGECWEAV